VYSCTNQNTWFVEKDAQCSDIAINDKLFLSGINKIYFILYPKALLWNTVSFKRKVMKTLAFGRGGGIEIRT
jgi:hypothetical protein